MTYSKNNDCKKSLTPEFSIVTSCYFEEKSLPEFYSRLSKTMQSLDRSYEIIFVNDGSADRTFEILKSFYDTDENITTIIDLFKNSGQLAALTAGLACARGKSIIFIEGDLQLDPEDIPKLIKKYEEGYDIVSGYREHRQDALIRKLPSKIANMIMRKVSNSHLSDFGCMSKIVNGDLVRAFEYGPRKIFLPAYLIAKAGKVVEIPVNHHPRRYGKSGYNFKKLFAYNMENVVGMSQAPFQILSISCLFLALLFILRCIIAIFFEFQLLSEVKLGLILNMQVIIFLSLASVLSIIGELVIRNFMVLRKDPSYIIKYKFSKNREDK